MQASSGTGVVQLLPMQQHSWEEGDVDESGTEDPSGDDARPARSGPGFADQFHKWHWNLSNWFGIFIAGGIFTMMAFVRYGIVAAVFVAALSIAAGYTAIKVFGLQRK